MPLFLIYINFNIHSHSTIHSFILHHSSRPAFLYPHRFFAQQEKNIHGVPSRKSNSGLPYNKPTHYYVHELRRTHFYILLKCHFLSFILFLNFPPEFCPCPPTPGAFEMLLKQRTFDFSKKALSFVYILLYTVYESA
jgi:hypothetical protein